MRDAVFGVATMLLLGVIRSVFEKLNDPFATLVPALADGALAACSFRHLAIGGGGTLADFSAAPPSASVPAIVAFSWAVLSRPARMARRTPPGLATR